jgi:hypothetical protein
VPGVIGFQGPGGGLGFQGSQGAPGSNAPPGPQGAQGATGPQGAQGAAGPQGAQGATGSQGATGPPAVTCYNVGFVYSPFLSQLCNSNYNFGNGWRQTSTCADSGYWYSTEAYCQASDTCCWTLAYNYYSCDYGGTYGQFDSLGYGNIYGTCASDVRIKQGIDTLTNSLENLMKIDAVEYDWNEKVGLHHYEEMKKDGRLHAIGLIAQNVRQYYPEVVGINSEGYYFIDYIKLNAVLVEAIKEQQVFIEDIDKELDFIESKLN